MASGPFDSPERAALSADDALDLLRGGTLRVEGRLVEASNVTLYCSLTAADVTAACVYKPIRGERPLWDFPDGTLAGREVGAYLVSVALGWDIVPPTVLREGPFGPGMCQLWIDVDLDIDLGELVRSAHPTLRRMSVFDAVVNNADRKGGHLLPTADGHIYGIDHGVCFAADDKLRTVLWGWRGQPLTGEGVTALRRLHDRLGGDLGEDLRRVLIPAEVAALDARIRRLLDSGRHPMPSGEWPPVPWPPF